MSWCQSLCPLSFHVPFRIPPGMNAELALGPSAEKPPDCRPTTSSPTFAPANKNVTRGVRSRHTTSPQTAAPLSFTLANRRYDDFCDIQSYLKDTE